jgi:acylphosphatase
MKEPIQRVTIRYEGRVQGVGFRFTVVRLAQSFKVTGTVRNQADGSVELIAEGVEGELMGLINAIRLSPLGRGISEEHIQRSPGTGRFESFVITY